MNKNYIVSWTDNENNEWLGDWMGYNEAVKLFNEISGSEDNKVDYNQICSELYSDIDNKVIMKYDYYTNRYSYFN